MLYNGKSKAPDKQILRLSNLIKWKGGIDVDIDLKVIEININCGHNTELLNDCPILKEYVLFIAEVREQTSIHGKDGFAIAIDKCINKGILAEYLKKNRRHIMSIFMGEYDQEVALEVARQESYDMGIERGSYNTKIETATNLLGMGLPIENIATATGLTKEEIEKL